ncbi:tyrosine-type recombinase/integrase [Desulfonatronum parangueonense]
MAKRDFSARFLKEVLCDESKVKLRFYDGKCKGLMLEVRPTGTKTYFLRYQNKRGKTRQIKLGRVEDLNITQVRALAHRYLGKIAMGEDPLEEQRIIREVPTLMKFTQEQYLPYVKSYKKSWGTDETLLRVHIFPKLGGMHLDQISREDISGLHQERIAAGAAPASADRLVILLRYIFNLAIKWKVAGVQENPTKDVVLFNVNNNRERFLSSEELQKLVESVKQSENPLLEPIILMLVLTGARKRELLDAKWEDFDLDRKAWRIPITKSGKPRTVPLSDTALEVLAELPKINGCEYAFANPRTKEPFVSIFSAWNAARKRAGLEDVRIHDLRHSFASFLINAGRGIYEVANLLGHTQLKTTQRYAHLADQTLRDAVNTVPLGRVA